MSRALVWSVFYIICEPTSGRPAKRWHKISWSQEFLDLRFLLQLSHLSFPAESLALPTSIHLKRLNFTFMSTSNTQCPSEESTCHQLHLQAKRQVQHARQVWALSFQPATFGNIKADNSRDVDELIGLELIPHSKTWFSRSWHSRRRSCARYFWLWGLHGSAPIW